MIIRNWTTGQFFFVFGTEDGRRETGDGSGKWEVGSGKSEVGSWCQVSRPVIA
jgi:hypothetical protein